MKKVTQADLEKMQQGGAKVRKKIGSRPAKKEPVKLQVAPEPPPEKPVVELTGIATAVANAANTMDSALAANNKIILALQAKLIERQEAVPHSYKFTVHRDSYGYIETVDAVPGKI